MFDVDPPALLPQLDGDVTIPVPRMLHMQDQDIVVDRLVFLGQLRRIPLRTAGLTEYLTSFPFGDVQPTTDLLNQLPSSAWD